MELFTRRRALRTAGGVAGVFGATGAGLVPLLAESPGAEAAGSRKVRITLNRTSYAPGQSMTLRIRETWRPGRRIRVRDSSGLVWTRVRKGRHRQVWRATAGRAGSGVVHVVALRRDGTPTRGRRHRDRVGYQVVGSSIPTGAALIGMSSPAAVWSQRRSEVGAGLAARRIFADLADGPTSQVKLVEETHAAGLLPVISYKVGGDAAGAAAGAFNAVAEQAATRLASYGLPTAVTFWHEPHGNLSGAQYAAASQQLLPIFRRGELRVGPLLNGWLMDRNLDVFGTYCPDELFGLWDWFGIDTYESGTLSSPGAVKPAQRIPALATYVKARGFELPLGIGEYNGYSATSISAAGQALLTTPGVWFGCLWNATGGKGVALSGDRLSAFQQTLADPRSARPRTATAG